MLLCEADVVFMFDCNFYVEEPQRYGSKESIWACKPDYKTWNMHDKHNNSFTRNLITELQSLAQTRFNVAMLHAKLIDKFCKPNPITPQREPWYAHFGHTTDVSAELTAQPPKRPHELGKHKQVHEFHADSLNIV